MTWESKRDFVGYAGNPPNPQWPNGARLAINFVVNYEEGSEASMQDGEGFTETALLETALATVVAKTGRSRADAETALARRNPQARFLKPEEVAETVLFLCTPAAQAITGQAISVSGGEV